MLAKLTVCLSVWVSLWWAAEAKAGGVKVHIQEAVACKRAHQKDLMKLPGVTGVGVTRDANGNPAVLILLKEDTPQIRAAIPCKVEGLPTVVKYTGLATASLKRLR